MKIFYRQHKHTHELQGRASYSDQIDAHTDFFFHLIPCMRFVFLPAHLHDLNL